MIDVLAEVIHHLVVSAGDVDLGDDAGLQTVHQLAEDDAVAQSVLEGHGREAFIDHRLHPFLGLHLLLGLPLSGTLEHEKDGIKADQQNKIV